MNTKKTFPCIIILSIMMVMSSAFVYAQQKTEDTIRVKGAAYLSAVENEVVREINKARTNPRAYAAYLEQLRPWYQGEMFEQPGKTAIMTREGVSALEEAIQYLRSAKRVPELVPSRGMSSGAKELVMEQKATGKVGHIGKDGSGSAERVNRYGEWQKSFGENIEYGGDTPRTIVINLIIDDGVPGRGHRNNLFDGKFMVVGVSCGRHKVYRHMCVINFADEYTDK